MKVITIELDKKQLRGLRKRIESQTSKNFVKALDAVLSQRLRHTKTHFEQDKWPLNFQAVKDEILDSMLGPVDWYLAAKFISLGLSLRYNSEGTFLTRAGKLGDKDIKDREKFNRKFDKRIRARRPKVK